MWAYRWLYVIGTFLSERAPDRVRPTWKSTPTATERLTSVRLPNRGRPGRAALRGSEGLVLKVEVTIPVMVGHGGNLVKLAAFRAGCLWGLLRI